MHRTVSRSNRKNSSSARSSRSSRSRKEQSRFPHTTTKNQKKKTSHTKIVKITTHHAENVQTITRTKDQNIKQPGTINTSSKHHILNTTKKSHQNPLRTHGTGHHLQNVDRPQQWPPLFVLAALAANVTTDWSSYGCLSGSYISVESGVRGRC